MEKQEEKDVNKKKKKKKKNQGQIESEQEETNSAEKKIKMKKSIKFILPGEDSQESFVSAISKSLNEYDVHDEDDDDDDDVDIVDDMDNDSDDQNSSKQILPLQTGFPEDFTFSPRLYTQPREVNKSKESCKILDSSLLEGTSSLLLNEISSNTPIHGDENKHLIHAIYLRNLNDVKKAIANGANVNCLSGKETPLLIATEIGDAKTVSYLLTIPNININKKNEYGQAALSVAVRNSFDEIVALLLNMKADVNTQDHLGRTPLHNALFQEKKKMVYRLLAFEADVEIEDCFGERAIYTSAVKKPNLECLKILLKEGASTNYLNFSKVPLLSRTIMNATHFPIIETLVEYGALVNLQDLTLRTPLHYAALSNHLRAAEFLVLHGANINIKSLQKFTPLDEAKAQGNTDVADYLEGIQGNTQSSLQLLQKKNLKGNK